MGRINMSRQMGPFPTDPFTEVLEADFGEEVLDYPVVYDYIEEISDSNSWLEMASAAVAALPEDNEVERARKMRALRELTADRIRRFGVIMNSWDYIRFCCENKLAHGCSRDHYLSRRRSERAQHYNVADERAAERWRSSTAHMWSEKQKKEAAERREIRERIKKNPIKRPKSKS